ncbi:peptidylprolyl isomerase [Acidisoma cellulosilytica]|uniref:Parvulin-like PPIase n=1 Tax=Acidisoma cellulosilyticum TaxID=2802395 RepID=A0A963YYU7_9PROT|nr:peptidylprolyl isomerase [Acidisoma cellulosilyticum]MCB8879682.1 peptidylprolyl isomerase [Acidisoma cellulosilyticum]
MRLSRFTLAVLASTALAYPLAAQAQSSTAPAATTTDTKPKNPVIATVNGEDIYLSDMQDMSRNLPQQLQSMSPEQLYPILLDQLVDQKAMAVQARKDGLMNDPAVKRQIEVGTEQVLQGALIRQTIGPDITADAIKAIYDKDYANKPGVEEIHARHILVASESQAEDIIKQLDKGADFATLAKKYSTDPGSVNGGDLGWFKKTDMVPAFADAAFAMKDNQISQTPVHSQFGYHVIQVLGHRTDAAPALADVQDKIRNQLIQEGIHKLLAQARAGVTVKEFAPDGSPMPAAGSPAAPAASGN